MEVRTARRLEDVQNVRAFVEEETWDHARTFLASAPEDPFADHLRWLADDGTPVACVQVFLHRYQIGAARLGLCLPEYPFVAPELRGRGHFKALMADLFSWMVKAGYPLAYDHGQKGLYTRLGFAPCFHHSAVLVRVADALQVRSVRRVEEVTEAQVSASADLFRRPFPLGRGLQCRDELWQPDPRAARVVRGERDREITGFVVLDESLAETEPTAKAPADSAVPHEEKALTVTDAWSCDAASAAALLRAAAGEARRLGFAWLRLNCRRDDPFARLAVLAGGELRWSAGQERDHTSGGEDVDAFYLADLRLGVRQLLPEFEARWRDFGGEGPPALALRSGDDEALLRFGGEIAMLDAAADDVPCLRLPRKPMTRAIMGYATPTELSLLHEGCDVPASCRELADALFPAREPHLIHEGLAFATPGEFGLVP